MLNLAQFTFQHRIAKYAKGRLLLLILLSVLTHKWARHPRLYALREIVCTRSELGPIKRR